MKNFDVLQADQESFGVEKLPGPDALLLLLKNTAIRQRLLSHPAIVGTLVSEAVARSGLTCVEVEERLAAFIDVEADEAARLPVHQAVAAHVHSCPWCYDIYALTHEILAAQKDGTLPRWPD